MKEKHSGIEERKIIEFVDGPRFYAAGGILDCEEYILNNVLDNPGIFQYVSPELYRDTNFVLDAARINGQILAYPNIRYDKDGRDILNNSDVVLAAVQSGVPEIVFWAEPDLLLREDFLLQAVKYNPKTLFLALFRLLRIGIPPERLAIFQNTEFLRRVAEVNWNVLLGLLDEPFEIENYLQPLTMDCKKDYENKSELNALRERIEKAVPDNLKEIYIEAQKRLSELNIASRTQRVSAWIEAKQLVAYRNSFQYGVLDNRPIVVILYPKSDRNNAYDGNAISKILAEGNQALLFEISNDKEMKETLRSLYTLLPREQKISLIIGGHGTKDTLLYDERGNIEQNFYYFLDKSDFDDPEFVGLLHNLNIGRIILESCSTGQNESGNDEASEDGVVVPNLADLLSEHVRPDCLIFAPKRNTAVPEYLFNSDGSINRPIYSGLENYTYPTRGKFEEDLPQEPCQDDKNWFFEMLEQVLDFFRFSGVNKPAYAGIN